MRSGGLRSGGRDVARGCYARRVGTKDERRAKAALPLLGLSVCPCSQPQGDSHCTSRLEAASPQPPLQKRPPLGPGKTLPVDMAAKD